MMESYIDITTQTQSQPLVQRPFTPKKIGLVDVDDTLKLKLRINGQSIFFINQNVINDLIKNGIKDIYLFTNMGFSDLTHVPVVAEEQVNYLTRRQLIEYLKTQGINVLGVITQADVAYNKGLGAAYYLYDLAYDDCLEDSKKYQQDKNKLNSYQTQFESYNVSHLEGYNEKYQAESQKKFMFLYFQEKIKDWEIDEIHYYEDYPTCIDAVNELGDKRLQAHLVNKKELNSDLLIPYQYDDQRSKITFLMNEEQKENDKKLTYDFIKLPLDLPSFRKSIQHALALLTALYNHCEDLRNTFDISAKNCFEQSFYNFTCSLTQKLNSMESNRAWVTLTTFVLAMLEKVDAKKYKQVKAVPNCETMFNLLEQIFPDFEKKLNLVVNETKKELGNKLMDLSDEQKSLIQKHLFLDYSVDNLLKEINIVLGSLDKKSLFIWENPNSKIKMSEYEKAIIRMTKVIFECNHLIKDNKLIPQQRK